MKKFLLVILVVVLAAPAVGFNFDDDPKMMPRMPSGGGYCSSHNVVCPTFWIPNSYYGGQTFHYPCTEQGVMPPNINSVYWENSGGGTCGVLYITFDGGDHTTVNCNCGMM